MTPIGNIPLTTILLLIVVLGAIIDIRIQKIPNLMTFPAMLLGLGYYTAVYGRSGLLFSLAGMAMGMALLLLPWLLGGMGAGDAKLMGAVGAFLGARATVSAFLCIAIIGCVCALVVVVCNRERFRGYFKQLLYTFHLLLMTRRYIPDPASERARRPRVYYGIPIALGTICYVGLESAGIPLW